jgi:hypothetical protein
MPHASPFAWAHHWPLPTAEAVQDKLVGGRTLTPADRLALFRDGLLETGPARRDAALRLAAQAAYFEGDHGQHRPGPSIGRYLRSPTARADVWPVAHTDTTWPAWEGEAWTTFAHRATVAVWLAEGANPWTPWASDRHGPWGLPEVAIAAADLGMLQRILASPRRLSLAALMDRRLAPLQDSRGLAHVPWLHAAATHTQGDMLSALLAEGFDPNQPDAQGRTPLFYAATPTQVERLLSAGAAIEVEDQAKQSLRGFLARLFPDFDHTIAPLLDRFGGVAAPVPTGPSAADIQAAFGQGSRGNWPPVAQIMADAGPVWTTWRQPLTLKNGTVRPASWLATTALGLLDTASDPRHAVDFNWAHEKFYVIEAAERVLQDATTDLLAHESLPGLPDGLLWRLLLTETPSFSAPQALSYSRDRHAVNEWREATEGRFNTSRNGWKDALLAGRTAVELEAAQIEGMYGVLNQWGTPGFWRTAITGRLNALFGNPRAVLNSTPLLARARERFADYRLRPFATHPDAAVERHQMTQSWEKAGLALARVMGDKALRSAWAKDIIAATDVPAEMRPVLFPPAVRGALGSQIWLALAEEKTDSDYFLSDREENRWRATWTIWAQEGATLDAKRLGARGLAKLQQAFPTVAATVPQLPRPTRRASP